MKAELILCSRIYKLTDSLVLNDKKHLKLSDVHLRTYLPRL